MAQRKSDSAQKAALRKAIGTFMQENNAIPKMALMLIPS